MSNDAANALASLGLDLGSNDTTVNTALTAATDGVEITSITTAQADEAQTEAQTAADEAAFEVGETEDLFIDYVPALERRGGGGGRSRYNFTELVAPSVDAAGKPKIAGKLIKFAEGDDKKFRRSVQSAVTAANKRAKESNEPTYFVTRSVDRDGKFVGIAVYRTDDRPADDEKTAS